MPIAKHIDAGSFSPEEINMLLNAFESALSSLGLADRADPLVELVAERIIHFARLGERDPNKLCQSAVDSIGR